MMPYIQIFMDKEEALNLLSDAERGRLLSALMEYNRTGVCAQLAGNERLVFPFFRDALDASKRLYEQRAEASAKGGESRKQATRKPTGSRTEAEGKPNTSRDEADRKPKEAEGKPNEAKNKNKNKNTSSSSKGFQAEEEEVTAMTEELDEILAAAEDAGLTLTVKAMDTLNALVTEYGASAVLDAISYAAEHTTQGRPNLAYIRTIAESGERSKPKDKPVFVPDPHVRLQLVGASGEVVGELGLPAQS